MIDAEILGVSEDATPQQIKEAWRVLARKLHPDAGGDPMRFIECYEAYQRLMQRPCVVCRGVGVVDCWNGLSRTALPCPRCRVQ